MTGEVDITLFVDKSARASGEVVLRFGESGTPTVVTRVYDGAVALDLTGAVVTYMYDFGGERGSVACAVDGTEVTFVMPRPPRAGTPAASYLQIEVNGLLVTTCELPVRVIRGVGA